ncbi:hypothetical protein C3K47_13855 [Solitalea longa]|uniref:Uncharacterized protein n=1 Tax=Solitalea longa TaxID=2079460 RepID=A0A2S4ZZR2_9SPHI|nr:hypothetical protein [Solitalea longa]POY35831.1 hypothetical protein C3K47_13855 [Solitalea longa]
MKLLKKLPIITMIVVMAQQLSSCGAEAVAALFIPLISAKTWTDQADDQHTFFFNVDTEGKSKSNFIGNENIEGNQDRFSGYYDEHYIEFTYTEINSSDATKLGAKYTGKIEDQKLIRLKTNKGKELVLTSN